MPSYLLMASTIWPTLALEKRFKLLFKVEASFGSFLIKTKYTSKYTSRIIILIILITDCMRIADQLDSQWQWISGRDQANSALPPCTTSYSLSMAVGTKPFGSPWIDGRFLKRSTDR